MLIKFYSEIFDPSIIKGSIITWGQDRGPCFQIHLKMRMELLLIIPFGGNVSVQTSVSSTFCSLALVHTHTDIFYSFIGIFIQFIYNKIISIDHNLK